MALLPKTLFGLCIGGKTNFQHGAPSTENDVSTHAQRRSEGMSGPIICSENSIIVSLRLCKRLLLMIEYMGSLDTQTTHAGCFARAF